MEVGTTLYLARRSAWRSWLAKHHASKKEIWLIFYKKHSKRPRLPYSDAVEEALCFGWIDSIVKPVDRECFAQRFSPRRPGSRLSEMNRERIRRLVKQKKMTKAGLAAVAHVLNERTESRRFVIAPDILRSLRKDKSAWKNFQKFPLSYKRIRIGWIEGSRAREDVFQQRLKYFIAMTAKNKRFGMVQ